MKEWTLILYGTYEDPNKHLDNSELSSISQQTRFSPPPPHSSSSQTRVNLQTSLTSNINNQKQASMTNHPPGPIQVVNQQQHLSQAANHHHQQPGNEASSRPAWSFPAPILPSSSSAPPPPPAPLPPAGSVQSSQNNNNNRQQQTLLSGAVSTSANTTPVPLPPPVSTTTSSSSYVTTFKTIVNSSSLGQPTNQAKLQEQQSAGITSNLGTNANGSGSGSGRNQQHLGSNGKADFEIVSPAGINNQQQQQQPVTTTNVPDLNLNNINNSHGSHFNSHNDTINDLLLAQQKPNQQQNVFGDMNLPMKPAVSLHDQNILDNNDNKQQTTTTPSLQNHVGGEILDGNQIDLKLTKDYRSSGDHYGTGNTNTNSNFNRGDNGLSSSMSTNLDQTTKTIMSSSSKETTATNSQQQQQHQNSSSTNNIVKLSSSKMFYLSLLVNTIIVGQLIIIRPTTRILYN